MGFGINFTIDLKDNPFCDNLVLGFLLSEVKMNSRVKVKKKLERTRPGRACCLARHTRAPRPDCRGSERKDTLGGFYFIHGQSYTTKFTNLLCLLIYMENKKLYIRDDNLVLQESSAFPLNVTWVVLALGGQLGRGPAAVWGK